jgi:heme/copper-type cytochrome/quinol oxidase subunit 2
LLGEPYSAVGLDCLCSMVTMATKLFTVSLCRENRHISSSQNYVTSRPGLVNSIILQFSIVTIIVINVLANVTIFIFYFLSNPKTSRDCRLGNPGIRNYTWASTVFTIVSTTYCHTPEENCTCCLCEVMVEVSHHQM